MSLIQVEQEERQELACHGCASAVDLAVCRITLQQEESELIEKNQLLRPTTYGPKTILPDFHQAKLFPKIVGIGEFSGPWLPPEAMKLLNKLKLQNQLPPSELIKLMDMVADRAIKHFQLSQGKFAAITFSGRIVDLADTKLELLKRIQGIKYPEQIFVWKVGSDSFSGRL